MYYNSTVSGKINKGTGTILKITHEESESDLHISNISLSLVFSSKFWTGVVEDASCY